MLDFIYYPVSFILWCWHKVFGFVFGPDNAIAWILGIVFLTFTVRGILFKPFVKQVRSMKKMQDFAPEVKKLQKKYANDRQKQATEMRKLQQEHGVNPLGSCLPMLLQIPVFIGLNWVLRNFQEGRPDNYFFDAAEVDSYVNAKLFGINIGDAINHFGFAGQSDEWNWEVAPLAIPLMIIAAIATHLTARHSVARQNPASASQQTAMMNKLTLYIFPFGVLIFGAFFPIGLLIYWLANNGWTLGQQRLVYGRIDREEEQKKLEEKEKRDNLAPKPGQKPKAGQKPNKPQPGQKPATQNKQASDEASDSAESGSEGDPGKVSAQSSTGNTNGSGTSQKNGTSQKSGSSAKSGNSAKGGAWAKNGGNKQRPAGQGKKSKGGKRR
ncbi:membrane protein insertase YidC [Prauserella halophila]|uniref:Membrane protein insertase YidC n=1 Tax=Prauserella halophila TaxID=185641 RepID=A0ABN1WHL5_9PSEU|nr:membrane protein insertase YidC [Prauserella halophila]MCP2236657.1 YidC/Oxa1 family membrane protein insertase [Prauserella halophila]